jgi:hypothetical protein
MNTARADLEKSLSRHCGLALATWQRSCPNGPIAVSRKTGTWLISGPSGPTLVRVQKPIRRISACRRGMSLSRKAGGT